MPPTYTIGAIARHFGVDVWQVRGAILRGLLAEPPRVGIYRVWVESDLPRVRAALVAAGYLKEEPACV